MKQCPVYYWNNSDKMDRLTYGFIFAETGHWAEEYFDDQGNTYCEKSLEICKPLRMFIIPTLSKRRVRKVVLVLTKKMAV